MKLLLILYALSVAIVLAICIYFYVTEKKENVKPWCRMTALILFAPVTLVAIIVVGIKALLKKDPYREQEKQQRELHKARCIEYGPPVGTRYLTFEHISGAGVVYCEECGHKEQVIGFVHGAYECEIGRQCPQCHTFMAEYNRGAHYHTMGLFTEDCLCPKCGAVVHAKGEDWDKGHDVPLFCPRCHSHRLRYHMEYIT